MILNYRLKDRNMFHHDYQTSMTHGRTCTTVAWFVGKFFWFLEKKIFMKKCPNTQCFSWILFRYHSGSWFSQIYLGFRVWKFREGSPLWLFLGEEGNCGYFVFAAALLQDVVFADEHTWMKALSWLDKQPPRWWRSQFILRRVLSSSWKELEKSEG